MLRVARHAEAIAYIAEPLVATRFHPDSISSQLGVVDGVQGGFNTNLSGLRDIKHVKKRFLDQYGHEVGGVRRLRAGSRRRLREELLRWIVSQSLPERRPARTMSLVGQAARVEPTLLVAPGTGLVVAMSIAGPRGRAAARRLVGRSQPK
jgi:hypothetical protein